MKYSPQMYTIDIDYINALLKKDEKNLVEIYEENYHREIVNICEDFLLSGKNVMLLTGPSSSGKTTTAEKIKTQLISQGKIVHTISLDDFFKSPKDMPFWKDGQRNYESVDCLDLECFKSVMSELFENGKTSFPIFDFKEKIRSQEVFDVSLTENTCLIFEGIHALNPKITEHISKMHSYKVYVSVHSDFVLDGKILLPARDLRLIRRMLRDRVHRDTSAEATLHFWKYVLMGEEEYIHPYRELADYHINSAHGYEPLLYKKRMLSLLEEGEVELHKYDKLHDLFEIFKNFPEITNKFIPDNSVIQEFIR